MCRASGRGCTVIPCAPASRHVSAACTTSGSVPPRELRSTATLLTLTLSAVAIGSPRRLLRRGLGLGGRCELARLGLLAQPAQLDRVDHCALVAAAGPGARGIQAQHPEQDEQQRSEQ